MKNHCTTRKPAVLGGMARREFIQRYWQQRALRITKAFPVAASLVSPQDILAMACMEECESRLITANKQQNDWQCEHGPFSPRRIKRMPATNWTVLVQAVDQWIPDVAALLHQFEFLPRWRLDDIMISVAADGGGVGPHFDYYDVFLLQAAGQRCWQLGQWCDERTPLREHESMKLLRKFSCKQEYLLQAGDLLYVPAGLAHWGTAIGGNCMTISIGFRAASQRDVIQLAMNKLAQTAAEHVRYRDTAQAIDRDPFCINRAAVNYVQAMWDDIPKREREQALAQALGVQATEVRYPEHIEPRAKPLTAKQLCAVCDKQKTVKIQHHVASRFAYRTLSKRAAELYVNGEAHQTSCALAQAICHGAIPAAQLKSPESISLVLMLINQGLLLLMNGVS